MTQEKLLEAIREKRIQLNGGQLTDGKYIYVINKDGQWEKGGKFNVK